MRRGVHSSPSPIAGDELDRTSERTPDSERLPREALSKTLWGIDWSDHLPLAMGDGIVVHASTFERSLPFVREHYAAIFHEDAQSPFSTTRVGSQKERYYRLAGDFFEFKDGEKTIGLLVGTPVDWSTYYIRSAAVLPEYQRKGLVFSLLSEMFVHLKAVGIERVEADASPSNFATLGILTRLCFNVTGTTLSDRWGAQVRLTRFLHEESEDVFLRQFCSGVSYQLRARSRAQQ